MREAEEEIRRLIQRSFGDRGLAGCIDLEALEMAIRHSMHEVGGVLLEKLVNADTGGPSSDRRIDCRAGHEMEFVGYRRKRVTTVLSPIDIRRAYYRCRDCGEGVIPKDRELGIEGTSFSPGVRRMMARVGAKESFEEGRVDLEELAGVRVTAKEVERTSEEIGGEIEIVSARERLEILGGQVIPLTPVVSTLYIAIDGTGVPVVSRETEGRQGKDETGVAKTREVKLGAVFTQTTVNEEGFAVRDEDSTTYVGAIETAEAFGRRIYTEAVHRGLHRAQRVILLGDGAVWIRGIGEEHFVGAIQIVDLFHAMEHLSDLGKKVFGSAAADSWIRKQSDELKDGDVEKVIIAMKQLRPFGASLREEVERSIGYFETNQERMRYAEFRKQGLFVGSGVIEAGCKRIVGQRLKQSGMRWTVRGADAVIALRCCQLSGRWEDFWERRAAG